MCVRACVHVCAVCVCGALRYVAFVLKRVHQHMCVCLCARVYAVCACMRAYSVCVHLRVLCVCVCVKCRYLATCALTNLSEYLVRQACYYIVAG